jgi:prepilin-type N-terminal cleavage/methylation domain-containing protein/prepilin-type processing-associated H-X9-DG protein
MKIRAFTLIELLVVIAIIAVLAAILFPVFARAKGAAYNKQDLSNIRQLALVSQMYSEDNDEVFVTAGASDNWNAEWRTPFTHPKGYVDQQGSEHPWRGWGLLLQTYAKSREVFRSPFFPRKGNFTGECESSAGMELSNNYSINWMLGSDGGYGNSRNKRDDYAWTPSGRRMDQPVSMASVVQPPNTVLFLPSNSAPPAGQSWGCYYSSLEASDYINIIRFHTFYNDGGNLAFTDGHAKFLRAAEANAAGPAPDIEPVHRIYHWPARGLWMQSTMPDSTEGFRNYPRGFGEGPSNPTNP